MLTARNPRHGLCRAAAVSPALVAAVARLQPADAQVSSSARMRPDRTRSGAQMDRFADSQNSSQSPPLGWAEPAKAASSAWAVRTGLAPGRLAAVAGATAGRGAGRVT